MDFGKTVKKRLIDIDKQQTWLIDEVKARTGMYCDSSLLHRIFRGEVGGRVKAAICEILDIKEDS